MTSSGFSWRNPLSSKLLTCAFNKTAHTSLVIVHFARGVAMCGLQWGGAGAQMPTNHRHSMINDRGSAGGKILCNILPATMRYSGQGGKRVDMARDVEFMCVCGTVACGKTSLKFQP